MNTTQKLDYLAPVDFNNTVNLPVTHTWLNSLDSCSIQESVIPLIDLQDPQAVDQIKTASENWGLFQVINHGIPVEILEQIEEQTRRFFGLPNEQKMLALRSSESSTGYGLVPMSKFFNKLMWSEGFLVKGSVLEHARRVWPQAQDHSPFCAIIEDYQEQMKGVAEKITYLMFKSLGLSREDVEWFDKSTQGALQMNSYPICPDPTNAMGLAPHTDSSLMTLVYQPNNTKGLQLYRPDLGWVDVEPISNAIIVVVGDLMQIASNGRFKNVLHRAIVNKVHHRFSLAYIFGPNSEVKISPPSKLIKDGDFPMYRPISWKEFLEMKAMYFSKTLEMIGFNSFVEKSNALENGNEAPLASETEAIKG